MVTAVIARKLPPTLSLCTEATTFSDFQKINFCLIARALPVFFRLFARALPRLALVIRHKSAEKTFNCTEATS